MYRFQGNEQIDKYDYKYINKEENVCKILVLLFIIRKILELIDKDLSYQVEL